MAFPAFGSSTPAPGAPAANPFAPGGGQLPFAASPIDFSGNPAALSAGYASAYQNALNFSKSQYDSVLGGYQTLLSGIDKVGGAARQGIAEQYTAASGAAAQGLVSRGLGNTTVANSVQRGVEQDKAKADVNLADQLAQLHAGYQKQQLDFMERVTAQYPNASLYADLARMFGMTKQAQSPGNRFGMVQAPPGGGGYVPSGGGLNWPRTPGMFSGSSAAFPGGGYGGGGFNPALAGPTVGSSTPTDVAGYGKGQQGQLLASYGPSDKSTFDPSGIGPVLGSAAGGGDFGPIGPANYGAYAGGGSDFAPLNAPPAQVADYTPFVDEWSS